jgi:hypothetical protein
MKKTTFAFMVAMVTMLTIQDLTAVVKVKNDTKEKSSFYLLKEVGKNPKDQVYQLIEEYKNVNPGSSAEFKKQGDVILAVPGAPSLGTIGGYVNDVNLRSVSLEASIPIKSIFEDTTVHFERKYTLTPYATEVDLPQ